MAPRQTGEFFPDGFFPTLTDDERELARLETSWGDFSYSLRTGHRINRENARRFKILGGGLSYVHQQFEVFRERIERGESGALVAALDYACEQGVPLPYWLAREIRNRLGQVFETETSMHVAFDLSSILPERGKKARNARQKLKARLRLWVAVHEVKRNKKKSLHVALQEVLREQPFPFGMTEARRLFNEQERVQRLHLGKTDRHR
ncbi:MAG: hypothetical protein JNM79_03935 [Burkholderiales bacterium]|nr:hypothetical protein [Burkholderiales bacterium]